MKQIILSLVTVLMMVSVSDVWALKGHLATTETMNLLKQDMLEGRIKVGQTRLKNIRSIYGDARKITRTPKKIVYDYGDTFIEFAVNKYLRDWTFDFTYGAAYSDEIDDLRKDIQDDQIVGDFVTYRSIVKEYEEPTVAFETDEDGDHSVYYWGEIKLTFENYIVVQSIKGQNLDDYGESEALYDSGVLVTKEPDEESEMNEDATGDAL